MNTFGTGAAGYSGSYLCEARMSRGDWVRGVDRVPAVEAGAAPRVGRSR
jgi:nucleoside-diphosphate-sugar epimerase